MPISSVVQAERPRIYAITQVRLIMPAYRVQDARAAECFTADERSESTRDEQTDSHPTLSAPLDTGSRHCSAAHWGGAPARP